MPPSTIPEMRDDFSVIVKNLECLIESFTTKDDLSQEEYYAGFSPIFLGLVSLEIKMNGFSAQRSTDNKSKKLYSKGYKEMWKALGKLRLGTLKIEKKYLFNKSNQYFSWEHVYKTTKMRSDIIAQLKAVLKALLKIQKKLTFS
jgi:hypothetical protein